MQNEINYLNQLLIGCPAISGDINLALALTEDEDYDALLAAFSNYQATTPCKTNLMACVDRILSGAKA